MKFYKVLQDNFLWEKDAILKKNDEGTGYKVIDPIFYKNEEVEGSEEYISSEIVESQPEWFERVYKINLLTKVVYKSRAKAKESLSKNFK